MRTPNILVWALLLAGCATPPPSAYVSATGGPATRAAGVDLGRNAAGEACTQQPVGDGTDVFCGSWRQPSARIRPAGPTDPARLDELATASPWRQALDTQFSCGAPSPSTVLGDAPAVVLSCTRRIGGWPHVAIVASIGGRGWFADGVLPALPAMERGLGVASGRLPATAGRDTQQGSGADRLLAAALASESFGADDVGAFYTALRAGFRANLDEDFAAAETDFRKALELQQKIGHDAPATARSTMLLALQVSNQGRFEEADGLLARAKTIADRSGDAGLDAELLHTRALHEKNQGHDAQALALLDQAQARYAAMLPPEVLARRPRPVRARIIAVQSTTAGAALGDRLASRDLVSDEDTQAALLGLIETQRYRAIELRLLGRTEEADQALAAAQRLELGNDLRVPALAARLERTAGQGDEAAGDPAGAARQLEAARQSFTVAAPGGRPVAETLLLRAGALARLHQDEAALAACDQGTALLRQLGSGTRAALLQPCLDLLGARAARLGDGAAGQQALLSHAFEIAQLSQGSVTTEQIGKAAVQLAEGARDPKVGEAIRQEQQSSARLEALVGERDRAAQPPDQTGGQAGSQAGSQLGGVAPTSATDLADLDRRIAEARTAAADADAALQAASPNYGQLVQSVVPARDVLHALRPGEAFVAIDLADAAGWTFLLTDGHVFAGRIDRGLAGIAADVARLRAGIEEDQNGELPRFDTAAALALYQTTIGPVAAHLPGMSSLVIAPTGPLLSIPFGVLLTGPGDPDNLKQAPWLLRRAAIAHVPAAANFVLIRRAQGHATQGRPWFGFGDFRPVTSAQAERKFPSDHCGQSAALFAGLPPLPLTRAALEASRDALGGAPSDTMLGAAFTKDAVLRADLADVRVLHFYTHGLLPTDLHCLDEPAIITSAPDGAPDAGAALLTAGEVEQMKLDADAVILAACNSAGPAGAGGQSLSGLARAFFFAGARSMLVTHWSTDAASSAYLVLQTLEYTRTPGTGFAEALRHAELDLLDGAGTTASAKKAHPFFWAPFALIGEGGARAGALAGL